ncbi:hypothetical protein GCM10023085_58740 [Actinomadura viridis]
MVVDLPAPLGPTKPVTRPGRTVKDIPSSATVRPNRLRNPVTSMLARMPETLGNGGGAGVPRPSHLRRPGRERPGVPPTRDAGTPATRDNDLREANG